MDAFNKSEGSSSYFLCTVILENFWVDIDIFQMLSYYVEYDFSSLQYIILLMLLVKFSNVKLALCYYDIFYIILHSCDTCIFNLLILLLRIFYVCIYGEYWSTVFFAFRRLCLWYQSNTGNIFTSNAWNSFVSSLGLIWKWGLLTCTWKSL